MLLGSALIAFSVLSFVAAYGALSILWADYQDSPASTYLIVGLPFLAAALISAGLGIRFFTWGYRRI